MGLRPGTRYDDATAVRPILAGQGLRAYGSTSGYVGLLPAAAAGSVDFTLPAADGTVGQVLQTNGSGVWSFVTPASGVTAHGGLTGLTTGDDHTQYALLAGRSGGQTIIGGTGVSESLTLTSTSNATKGDIILGSVVTVNATELRFNGSTSGYVGLKGAAAAGSTIYTLPAADGTSGYVLQTNGSGVTSWVAQSGGVTDHGALTGLSDDDHSQYALLAGRPGGGGVAQTLYGGTEAGDDIVIASTSHATKGDIFLNDSTILRASKTGNTLLTSTTPTSDQGIVNRGYMRTNNLAIGSTQTSNFTASEGEIAFVNLTNATADFLLTFPVSPSVGHKFGVSVTAAHSSGGASTAFADRPFFCVEPLNATSINGSPYAAEGGEGGGTLSLWQAGETLIFQYTGSTWILIEDGRIPQICDVTKNATQSIANATPVEITYGSEVVDVMGLHSTGTNTDRIYFKRAGYYVMQGALAWDQSSTGVRYFSIYDSSPAPLAADRRLSFANSESTLATAGNKVPTEYIFAYAYHEAGAALDLLADGNFLRVIEKL